MSKTKPELTLLERQKRLKRTIEDINNIDVTTKELKDFYLNQLKEVEEEIQLEKKRIEDLKDG